MMAHTRSFGAKSRNQSSAGPLTQAVIEWVPHTIGATGATYAVQCDSWGALSSSFRCGGNRVFKTVTTPSLSRFCITVSSIWSEGILRNLRGEGCSKNKQSFPGLCAQVESVSFRAFALASIYSYYKKGMYVQASMVFGVFLNVTFFGSCFGNCMQCDDYKQL